MDAFIGEIRLLPYYSVNSIYGWCRCDGRKLLIRQYPALYAIIGNIYGGDLKTYFNVPNIIGRAVIGTDNTPPLSDSGPIGSTVGQRKNTIKFENIPAHTHSVRATRYTNSSCTDTPSSDTILSAPLNTPVYSTPSSTGATSSLANETIGSSGFQQITPVEINNMQPCLYINNYYICLDGGIFPIKD